MFLSTSKVLLEVPFFGWSLNSEVSLLLGFLSNHEIFITSFKVSLLSSVVTYVLMKLNHYFSDLLGRNLSRVEW